MDHLDLKLRGLWKIKKFAGDGENFLALLCCNAVSGQIEKSDIMRRFAQIGHGARDSSRECHDCPVLREGA